MSNYQVSPVSVAQRELLGVLCEYTPAQIACAVAEYLQRSASLEDCAEYHEAYADKRREMDSDDLQAWED